MDSDSEEEQDARGDPHPPLAIESLDDYVRRVGLPHAADEHDGGEFNGLNRQEAIDRVRAEEAYRDEVIEKHQAQQDATPQGESTAHLDEEAEGATISVVLAEKTTQVPLPPLMAFCETVKRMITSRRHYGKQYGVADDTDADLAEATEENTAAGDLNDEMMLSLVEFDAAAGLQFIDVLVSLHDGAMKEALSGINQQSTSASSRKRRINDDTDEATNKRIMELINEGKISEENIVECVKIAHFLQCTVILETLTSILELSIDSHNCMAICSLADALNLNSLFETSVNFVIERLDAFQGTSSSDKSDEGVVIKRASSSMSSDDNSEGGQEAVWASLPYELRSRVLTMKNVMRSSIIGRGSKVSGLFFSSGNEFLAIFRETIRDQKERLAEAKERSEEVIRERTEDWVVRCQRRGRWFDASAEAKKRFVYGPDLKYTLDKIQKQSQRLQTLESFYEEQKTIFKGGGLASEIRL